MTRIVYKTEPCSRCGGCGQYSYCQMYGTVCFKCRGKGVQLTRAARRAHQKIAEFKERYNRPASQVKPGMVIKVAHRWRTVLSTRDSDCAVTNNVTGDRIPYVHIDAEGCGLQTARDSTVEVRYTPEQFHAELLPFARRFSGVEVVED